MKRCIWGFWLLPMFAFADPPASAPVGAETEAGPPRHYGNLRVGASSATQNGRPELCLEVAPVSYLSIESCGTGSGFLHQDPQPELAHFRAKLKVADVSAGKIWLQPQILVGFAEMQIAEDVPGFDFRGTGPNGVATAGPEAGASLRTLIPSQKGVEFVTEISASASWLEHATELTTPQTKLQPAFSVSFGVGF